MCVGGKYSSQSVMKLKHRLSSLALFRYLLSDDRSRIEQEM